MKNHLLLLFIFFPLYLYGQDCTIKLSGYIMDRGTGQPLAYSNIYLEDQQKGTISDSLGYFEIKNLCASDFHVEVSHIGCDPEHLFFQLTTDTLLEVFLNHHAELLDEVVVHGNRADHSTQISHTISHEEIAQNSHKNLSDLLENISGVSLLKNGSGISKPVIHGLYGNRISILNNGIAQSGQQWGNDHAPEIDPFLANHISVVKGAAALAYGGTSLGSVVMVEVDKIRDDPHLHGQFNYIFSSNGRGNTLNTQLEKAGKWASWRLTGTLKKSGDTKSPKYYLTNTGKTEGNIALQVEKNTSRWQHGLYYSLFNTTIGILRGAHIGNLTDLQNALGREIPFFTEPDFSYSINAPRQKVQHHLLKLESKLLLNDSGILTFRYGGQLNDRKEFDVRRGGRSNIPALSIRQFNHFAETVYSRSYSGGGLLKTGLQFTYTDNTNDNETTGVLPLIPDYRTFRGSSFFLFKKEKDRFLYEAGARYEWINLLAIPFKKSNIGQISFDRIFSNFHQLSLSGGGRYTLSKNIDLNLNIGYTARAPEVNELYSNGLHQGVAGIERGSTDLDNERSLKILLSTNWNLHQKLFIQKLFYFQHIDNFIYLEPQNEFQLDIRGAFPVFLYKQTNARIYGMDLLLTYAPLETFKITSKFALSRGDDIQQNLPLINLPSNNWHTSFIYAFRDRKNIKNQAITFTTRYVFKQNHLLTDNTRFPDRSLNSLLQGQDFLPPPPAYFLAGLSWSANIPIKQGKLQYALSVDNLFNQEYQDYLNRLRYFALDTGINLNVRLNYSF